MKPELAQKKLDQMKQKRQRSDFWKPSPGDNHIRFLPRWDGNYDGEMFRETAYHRNLGTEKDKSAVCLRHEGQEKCPVCEVVSELYKNKTDEDKELAKSIKAQVRVAFNIIDLDEPEKGPQVYMAGVEVMEQVLRYIANPKYGAIDNPQSGRNCLLVYTEKKNTKTGFPETNIQADPDISSLADMEWLEKMHDLDSLIKAISYDELYALLWGTEVEKSEEVKNEKPTEPEKPKDPPPPPPPCLDKGKFNQNDSECVSCFYAKPCGETKRTKEAKEKEVKPAEKPADKPKPGEGVKSLLNKLKEKKEKEPF